MSPDPFDDLRRELVAGAARAPRRRLARAPRRGLVLALLGLGAAGTATAAVVATQAGTPSAPASGPLPAALGAPAHGRTYAISVAPDLRAGAAGWCYSLALRREGRFTGGGVGCGGAFTSAIHLLGGGVTTVPGGALDYAVVTPDVAAVRFSKGRRIAPRADPALPYDWRIAVLRRPGEGMGQGFGGRALDASGSALPNRLDGTTYAVAAPVARPGRRGRCAIGGVPAGYRAVRTQVAARDPKVPALRNPAFFSCAQTVLRTGADRRGGGGMLLDDDRTAIRVAVLLDAAHPERPAAGLPSVAGWSARRAGPGWLVVAGGSAAQRRALLSVLQART